VAAYAERHRGDYQTSWWIGAEFEFRRVVAGRLIRQISALGALFASSGDFVSAGKGWRSRALRPGALAEARELAVVLADDGFDKGVAALCDFALVDRETRTARPYAESARSLRPQSPWREGRPALFQFRFPDSFRARFFSDHSVETLILLRLLYVRRISTRIGGRGHADYCNDS
jgi:hypothetical protein